MFQKEDKIKLCECGCGQFVKPGNRFINGHNWRSKKHLKKTIELMSIGQIKRYEDPKEHEKSKEVQNRPEVKLAKSVALTGVPLSPEHCAAIAAALTGVPKSPEHCAAISATLTGVLHSSERCVAVAAALTGVPKSPEHIAALIEGWNKPGVKERASISHMGNKNPMFIDGLSNKNHFNFTPAFCRRIRIRDNNICQICGKTNEQNINETTKCLEVHHIHYDPETNDCSNDNDFITLCNSCHCKTTFGDREYWENYFIMQ